MADNYYCINCSELVSRRQHAICCDSCNKWQHRKCKKGWHRRINSRAARADLGLYMLLPLLKTEARTVDLQIRLVSQHLLTRLHRARYARVHGALFDAWDQYEDGDLTTTQLLRRCSNITGLCEPTNCNDKVYEDDN